jgi:hypothetical protein
MLLRKAFVTVGLLTVFCSPALAQVKLEHKIAESKTTRSEVTSHTTQQ